jgi:hypothetical protein
VEQKVTDSVKSPELASPYGVARKKAWFTPG